MSKQMLGYFTLSVLLLLLLPPPSSRALTPPEGFAPGPDVIVGNLPALTQAGSNGTQVGLALGTDICNNGDVALNFFAMPNTDHPLIPQNLYRMSGGANNDERFEQIGQSWAKHSFFALEQNACGFGCTASGGGTHLGPGCSNSDTASLNGSQAGLGSRAWVNPYTGAFPANSADHSGHTHDGTTHRILMEASDLDPAQNAGATYYAEAQLVTPHEYAWCQAHPGECNMFNNVAYRQFTVAGTTTFSFSPVGATIPTPAIFAWPGATIQTIEPEPGIDGRAFIAYKVTGPVAGVWQYEYAIYNENLDRGIQSFSVPGGCGFEPPTNLEFHAPLNHPGIANDGTAGNFGYLNTPWTAEASSTGASWHTEDAFKQPNANALRWGTLYNFRFQHTTPPVAVSATIGFFKPGFGPITVPVLGPASECLPTPSPTPSAPPPTPTPPATATPTATPTPTSTPAATPPATPSPTSTPVPTPSATPSPTAPPAQALNISTRLRVETGGRVLIGGFIITGGAPKTVAIRGIGPSLAQFGVPGVLADPTLELRSSTGELLQQNDNWQADPEQAAQLTGLGLALQNSNEAGMISSLSPAAYTAVMSGNTGGTGVGLVELYDTNPGADSQLANVSTRGFVQTGDNVMIGGFILGGAGGDTQIVVRGIGPSLSQFGIDSPLGDPTLELRDNNGALLIANDDWQSDPAQAAQLSAHGFALSQPAESGIFVSLPPGTFTAILAGKNGGHGIGVVEIYHVP